MTARAVPHLRDYPPKGAIAAVQVGRLRKKLQPDDTSPQLIRTLRGAGYVFTAAVETVQ